MKSILTSRLLLSNCLRGSFGLGSTQFDQVMIANRESVNSEERLNGLRKYVVRG